MMELLRYLIDINSINVLQNMESLQDYRRILHNRNDPFEMRDTEFIKQFRLNKDLVQNVIDIADEFSDPISRKSEIDVETKVNIVNFLLYYHFH